MYRYLYIYNHIYIYIVHTYHIADLKKNDPQNKTWPKIVQVPAFTPQVPSKWPGLMGWSPIPVTTGAKEIAGHGPVMEGIQKCNQTAGGGHYSPVERRNLDLDHL